MAIIRITNLRLRAIIGIEDWERKEKQDVVMNVEFDCDASQAAETDDFAHAVDYKALTKRIIDLVERSQFFLIEKLAQAILEVVMENPAIEKAKVRVDKPFALRFADSVSVELCKNRQK